MQTITDGTFIVKIPWLRLKPPHFTHEKDLLSQSLSKICPNKYKLGPGGNAKQIIPIHRKNLRCTDSQVKYVSRVTEGTQKSSRLKFTL